MIMTSLTTSFGITDLNYTTHPPSSDNQWGAEDSVWNVFVIASICVGTIGNVTLIYVILRNAVMRNTRNLLLCNMAVGDLLLIFSIILYNLQFSFPEIKIITWTTALCKLIRPWQLISQGVSVLSLTWLSIERYQACMPIERSFVTRFVTLITVSIWIVAIVYAIPLIIGTYAVHGIYCEGFKNGETAGRIYNLFQFVALYLLPLIITAVNYALIVRMLYISMNLMPQQTSNRNDQIRRRKRSSSVLLLITIMFAVCWLPHFVYTLVKEFHPDTLSRMSLVRAKRFAQLMINLSVCINPVTLFLISKRHRYYFRKYLCCATQRARRARSQLVTGARSLFMHQAHTNIPMETVHSCNVQCTYSTLPTAKFST